MKAGVNLLNFGPAASPESLARWTGFVESLGYHLAMACDHVAVTRDVHERYPAPLYDPFATLSWLAAKTSTIELGTTVIILPYRDPILTARMVASLDQFSGGRFIFGVGVGWSTLEFEALDLPFHRRGAMTDEYLAAMKELWSEKAASFEGEFTSFKEVLTAPLPVQRPHPPIWVGGASDAAIKRAVIHGDAWHPMNMDMNWLRGYGVPALKRFADEAGKPAPAFSPRVKLHITDRDLPEEGRKPGIGSLSQVRDDLGAFEDMGAEYVLLDTYMDVPEDTITHEPAWAMLMAVAESVFDLGAESLR
ncbi:MAG: LLM class F420-dependent oxidoreductase [Dehalococcoidia bacterium]|jgi:probable F420-dependent oxidoreductase|nr:LLM class F420-dependent oxidoreductase [Dehalococcoidia bacterium]